MIQILTELISIRINSISLVLIGSESLNHPGRDTNPSQVSSQKMPVLIYLPLKDGKLNYLRQKRRSHKYSNLGNSRDQTGDLVVGKQRSYICANYALTKQQVDKDVCFGKSISW